MGTPEERARHDYIDPMLKDAGWSVQDMKDLDFTASRGVAVREFPLKAGFADYMLFVDRQAVGVVEAKKVGTSLGGVDTQSGKYLDGLPAHIQRVGEPLPFAYDSTGIKTRFRDVRDPEYRSRQVYSFHRPGTLIDLAREPETLRARLKEMPPLETAGLRDCQIEAIEGLEHSLAENRPRALIQMATGSGKTFTAVSAAYRLIKHAGAKRVLFLVDRANLGRQTLKEFQQYATPDDGRKFTELYNVQHLAGGGVDPVGKVCISTIQRLYSMLRGEELEEEIDESSLNEITPVGERPKEVAYNPRIPIETFDFVIVDECRSRTSPVLRVAVTVDMISTGTDVKPLEALIFMRDVKSQTYYEQMVGCGTRTISETDLKAVTGDANRKTHFVLIDAIGVTETAKGTDVRPLERKPTVAFDKLLGMISFGSRDADTLTTLASRLSRLDRQLGERGRQNIRDAAGGKDPSELANALLDAVDPDEQRRHAVETNGTDSPTEDQIEEAAAALAEKACGPFDAPGLRNTLTDLKKRSEQVIDRLSEDRVVYAGYDYDKARQMVTNFEEFIEKNKDELTALQIIYNRPYTERHLTLEEIRQLADALDDPPYLLDAGALWHAYERLESAKVRGASPQRLLTDMVSLVRFAMGKDEVLEPYPALVERRFEDWLARHDGDFTPEQVEWLRMIKDHIAASLNIEPEDFGYAPFSDRGGRLRASRLFGPDLPKLLDELNEELAA